MTDTHASKTPESTVASMVEGNTRAASEMNTAATTDERETLIRRLLDICLGRRFGGGYDFFISYCWADGRTYALALHAELKKRGFRSFLDSEDYEKGSDWKIEGHRALKQASRVLLVLTPGSINSDPVAREIRLFRRTGRTICPIDLAKSWLTPGAERLRQEIGSAILNIVEPGFPEVVRDSGLSEHTLIDITNSFKLRRQTERRIRALGIAASILFVLTLLAIGSAGIAYYERGIASANARKAQHNLASNNLSNAHRAIRERRYDEALHWYLLACRDAPEGDSHRASAHNLLASWANQLRVTLPIGYPDHIQISPDGKTLFVADMHSIQLWNALTLLPSEHRFQHDGVIRCAAFSRDGKSILTGCDSYGAQLWDAESGCRRGDALVAGSTVLAVAFSPDGSVFLTATDNGRVQLWDAKTGAAKSDSVSLSSTKPARCAIRAVAFSPDSRLFLAGCDDGTAQLWSAESNEYLGVTLPVGEEVIAVAFSRDGDVLLTGTSREVGYWDTKTGEKKSETSLSIDAVRTIAFGSEDDTFFVGTGRGIVRHDTDGEGYLYGRWSRRKILGADEWVAECVFSSDDAYVFVRSQDQAARLLSVKAAKSRSEQVVDRNDVRALEISPIRPTILIGCKDDTTQCWDVDNDRYSVIPWLKRSSIRGASFSPNGHVIVVNGEDGHTRLLDATTGDIIQQLGDEADVTAFSPDSRILLTGRFNDNEVKLWVVETKGVKKSAKSIPFRSNVRHVGFSPDGSMFFAVAGERMQLWNARTLQPVSGPPENDAAIAAVAFSPDGSTILVGDGSGQMGGSKTGKVQLWNTLPFSPKGEPIWHSGFVVAAAFSPNGRSIVTATEDVLGATVQIWDVSTRQPLGEAIPYRQRIEQLAFCRNGESILVKTSDETEICDVVPPSMDVGDVDWLRMSVEVRTASTFDEETRTIKRLTQAEWQKRRDRLWKEFGGPCDVRTWDQVGEAEKKQLRDSVK